MDLIKWIQFSILILNFGRLMAIPDREQTDYCEMFGKDDIQGKREYCFLFSSDLTLYIYSTKERNMLFWLETKFIM